MWVGDYGWWHQWWVRRDRIAVGLVDWPVDDSVREWTGRDGGGVGAWGIHCPRIGGRLNMLLARPHQPPTSFNDTRPRSTPPKKTHPCDRRDHYVPGCCPCGCACGCEDGWIGEGVSVCDGMGWIWRWILMVLLVVRCHIALIGYPNTDWADAATQQPTSTSLQSIDFSMIRSMSANFPNPAKAPHPMQCLRVMGWTAIPSRSDGDESDDEARGRGERAVQFGPCVCLGTCLGTPHQSLESIGPNFDPQSTQTGRPIARWSGSRWPSNSLRRHPLQQPATAHITPHRKAYARSNRGDRRSRRRRGHGRWRSAAAGAAVRAASVVDGGGGGSGHAPPPPCRHRPPQQQQPHARAGRGAILLRAAAATGRNTMVQRRTGGSRSGGGEGSSGRDGSGGGGGDDGDGGSGRRRRGRGHRPALGCKHCGGRQAGFVGRCVGLSYRIARCRRIYWGPR